jgi:hypothetical protein
VVEQGEERTTTVVRTLDAPARLDELVTMLGAPGEAGRRSVLEMLSEANAVKQRIETRG